MKVSPNLKEAIKTVLNCGGSIKVPYKSDLSSWYGDYTIGMMDGETVILPGFMKFQNQDRAIDTFLLETMTSKNIGYLHNRIMKRTPDLLDEYDLKKPTKEIKKIFKDEGKLVDEEFKILNITPEKQLTKKDAIDEIKVICEKANKNTIQKELSDFLEKYAMLSLSISPCALFDIKASHDYMASFEFKYFTADRIDWYTNGGNIKTGTFKKWQLFLHIGGGIEIIPLTFSI